MKKESANKKEEPVEAELTGRGDDRPIHERIAERAYELHQKRGSAHGYDLDDWLEAERIVLSERRAAAEKPAASKPKPVRARSGRKEEREKKAASS